MTTHDKEYRICKIRSERSLTNQPTTVTNINNNPWEGEYNPISRAATLQYKKCPVFNQISTKHAGKKKCIQHTGEKHLLIEAVPEEAQALDLLDKDVSATI